MFSPVLLDLSGETLARSKAGGWAGLKYAGLGWVAGFGGLALVVYLGKLAFGRKEMSFDEPEDWHLKEPDNDVDPLLFIVEKEEIGWWDIFTA